MSHNKLEQKMNENNISLDELAKMLKISVKALKRRLSSSMPIYTAKQMETIINLFNLQTNEIDDIFFNFQLRKTEILSNK